MSLPTTGVLFSGSQPAAAPGNQLCEPQTDGGTPAQIVSFVPRLATADLAGVMRPGKGLTVDATGTVDVTAVPGGGGGGGTSASGGALIPVIPQGAKDGSNTQFVLPAPLLAGTYGLAFLNGVLLEPLGDYAEYAVQGTQLTTKYPPQSTDRLLYYYIQGTPSSESGGGGSVTPVGQPVIRGTATGQGATGGASVIVHWPAGTLVGDLVVLGAANDWNQAVPGGWTTNDLSNGGTWNGLIASKVMTSADISAGSVTITAGGNDDFAYIVTAFVGSTGGVRETDIVFNGILTTQPITTSSAVAATDFALYYATGRSVGGGVVISIDRGAVQDTVTGTNSLSDLYTEALTAAGAYTTNFTMTTAGSGRYMAVIIVQSP